MKKFLIICVLTATMLTGIEVQATEAPSTDAQTQEDANEIIKKSEAVLNSKKIVRVVTEADGKPYTTTTDTDTQITYRHNPNYYTISVGSDGLRRTCIVTLEQYYDMKNNLMYYYYPEEKPKTYYVYEPSKSNSNTSSNADNSSSTTSYKDTTVYSGVLCYQIEEDIKTSSNTKAHIVHYINTSTYEPVSKTYTLTYKKQTSIVTEKYSYPNTHVTIPKNILKKAVLPSNGSVTINGIKYTAPSGEKRCVKVNNGKRATSTVTIPDKITVAGKKYKVTEIADKAFEKNKKLKKITLGKNIKTIGKQAFNKCKKLNRVIIRSTSIKKIGKKAFYGNAKKLKVQAPKSKLSKYRKLIKNAKTSSKLKM
ncbi:MAG: leucine-rich repeat protein [Lachnospiraceae bacterium]|nr:leucine-rich repeat protein [Lachnospiraceae bacterium]